VVHVSHAHESDEAELAHIDLHSEHSIAIHFGLIDNAAESYTAPVNDFAVARNGHGITEVTLSPRTSDRPFSIRGIGAVTNALGPK